ncbi:Protein TIFY 10B [Zea mays]|uniref:Protein TIFY 10B n=1 Tax=Zea mays TaxID=4577 RepID=A0A1D6IJJ8_MAIZE|nr:Protein TIFY 10B [Zea mays]
MAASARPGERATSFAVACSLLSRFVRQNGVAAADLGLRIKGEVEQQRTPATTNSLPGAEGEEVERRKEPESQPWLGLGPNAVDSSLNLS